MSEKKILVLDIETIPDLEVLPPNYPTEQFPFSIGHRVVTISLLLAEPHPQGYRISFCGSLGDVTDTEPNLIRRFWEGFERQEPRVVSWNGRGFDIPVLKQRAIKHGISAASWYRSARSRWEAYGQRYSPEWHCDLMDQFTDYGATRPIGLDIAARALDLPGKLVGHGSQVADMYAVGDLRTIRAYCECDVLNLYGIYIKWAFSVGWMSKETMDGSEHELVEYLNRSRQNSPHFAEFLQAWKRSQ